jgi:hypothetical protein
MQCSAWAGVGHRRRRSHGDYACRYRAVSPLRSTLAPGAHTGHSVRVERRRADNHGPDPQIPNGAGVGRRRVDRRDSQCVVNIRQGRLTAALSVVLPLCCSCAVADSFTEPDPAPSTERANESLWHFDFGVVAQPGLSVGRRTFYNFVSIGNLGSEPIRLDAVQFPELTDGLRITRVGLYPESEPELAAGEDQFPDNARPIDGSVLEPTDGVVEDIEDAFEDPRFYAVYVEVEVLAEGQWSIGSMNLTYTEAGATRHRRISEELGDACTTPVDETCMPSGS